jgi:DNA-binding CsgD family transcriptional regulator
VTGHTAGPTAPPRWDGQKRQSQQRGPGFEAVVGLGRAPSRPDGTWARASDDVEGNGGLVPPPVATLAPAQEVVRALGELALTVAQSASLEHLAFLAVDLARDLLGADAGSLFLWHEAGGHLASAAYNDPNWDLKAVRCFAPGEGVTGAAFQADRPLVVHDYPRSVYAVTTAVSQGLKSGVATALMVGQRRVGVLSARSYRYVTWTSEHARLLAVIAALVAPGLEHALVCSRRSVRLTPREEQVLAELMAGRTAKSISRAYGLSEATVRTHIRSVLTKFGVNSQLAAVALARELGFSSEISPDR